LDDNIDQCVLTAHQLTLDPSVECDAHILSRKDPDFFQLRPLFGWLSPDIIKKAFTHTTQYARLPTGTTLKRTFMSPNPALNVTRRNEPVACDIVYSDVLAINNDSIAAALFVGTDNQVTDVYSNLSIPLRTISLIAVLLTSLSVTVSKSSSVTRFRISYVLYAFPVGRASRISNNRIQLNGAIKKSSALIITSLTVLVLLTTLGCYALNMYAFYLIAHTTKTFTVCFCNT
jgi:hypothetical protein